MDPTNAQEAKSKLYGLVKAELPLALPDDTDYQNNAPEPEPGNFFHAMKRIKLQKEQEVSKLSAFLVLQYLPLALFICCPLIIVLALLVLVSVKFV